MKLSDSEWTVMTVIWNRSPASVRDVLESIGSKTDWAYSTVKTILERLVEKKALRVRKRANSGLFDPLITRQEARRAAVRSLLERAFDGGIGSLVQHLFVEEKLSRKDRRQLTQMLEELERPRERSE
jgi:BlaI family penicillinase repressor